MKTSTPKLAIYFLIFLALLVGCTAYPSNSNIESDETFILPSSPQVSLSDVFDQVFVEGGGGGGYVCDSTKTCAESRDNGLYLVKFTPGQNIHVRMYKYTRDGPKVWFIYYTGWDATVGSDGTLFTEIVNLDFFALYIIFDGNNDNMIVSSAPLMAGYDLFYKDQGRSCNGKSYDVNRFSISDRVKVVTPDGASLRLSYILGDNMGEIPDGAEVDIVLGPYCDNDLVWWWVDYNGTQGWLTQSDGNNWFLEK